MKEQKIKVDRITLKAEEALKLDRWIEQMTQFCPGISLSRAGLVSWLVSSRPEVLRPADRRELKDRFFNELKRAEWVVKEMREATKRGETPSITDFLSGPRIAPPIDATSKPPSKTYEE